VAKERECRMHIMLSREELESIDDWRFASRVPTRAKAVRLLVEKGLEASASAKASEASAGHQV